MDIPDDRHVAFQCPLVSGLPLEGGYADGRLTLRPNPPDGYDFPADLLEHAERLCHTLGRASFASYADCVNYLSTNGYADRNDLLVG